MESANSSIFSRPPSSKSYVESQMEKKFYAWEAALKKHISSVHEGIQFFQCENCDKCFPQKYELNRHL